VKHAHRWMLISALLTTHAIAQNEVEYGATATVVAVDKAAGSSHVIQDTALDRAESDDVHAVLTTVPGVYVRGEDGMGLRPNIGLRGVNPDRSKKVTLMEDGVLFGPAPYSAPAAYYFPVMTRMTEVQVIKGTDAVLYGPQTIGGAINLITRPVPTREAGYLDLASGQYLYRKFHAAAGMSAGHLGFLIEGVHLGNDGFKELPSGADTGFIRNEWMFKGVYMVVPNAARIHELRLKLTYSDEVSNETYLGLSDADFREDPLQRYPASALDRMENHRTSIVLTHVVEPTAQWTLLTDVYRHDYARTWRKANHFRGAELFDVLLDPEESRNAIFHAVLTGEADSAGPQETLFVGPNQRNFISQGIQTRARWQGVIGPVGHRAEYGVRMHYDRIDRRHGEDGFVLSDGMLYPEGTATSVTALNDAWSYALAGHATDALTWRDLTVTPGIRFELIHAGYEDALEGIGNTQWTRVVLPGLGVSYALGHGLAALAGLYRGFSPPAPSTAEDPKPELSTNYEAGFRFNGGSANAEVIGFYNNYMNLTDVCTFSSGCGESDVDRQFDAGKAHIYGAEVSAGYDLRWRALSIPFNLAYTLTHSVFLNGFDSEDPIFGQVHKGDEVPYVPRHQLSISLGVQYRRFSTDVRTFYVSRMREEAGSGSLDDALATDAQYIVDVGARYELTDAVQLYANAQNIFDSLYIVSRRPYGSRPNAPRWIHAGLKVRL
jgi:Fe(3+) dicitrate transport protein